VVPVLPGLRDDFDRLRGRLYELVECTGMPDDQQEAFKRLIRRTSYDVQSRLEGRLRGEDVE
jgi:hypothetical protein